MNTKQYFSDLKSALENRNKKIRESLEYCRTREAQIKARYSEAVAGEELAKLERDTREAIKKHDQEAHDRAEVIVGKLKADIAARTTGEANQSVLAKLQAAQTFGLKLSRSEIEGMATCAKGDSITLSCLAKIAETSGFKLTFSGANDFEQDMAQIMNFFPVPSLYAPDGLTKEALKLSPNRKYKGIDYGRPDAVAISIGTATAVRAVHELDDMSTRWNDSAGYQLK